MTRFSVIVPMREAEAFIDDCLGSVRRQTNTDFEVIVVDDDSPDTSGAIADRHAREDGRITVLHLESNHGVGLARNAGIARATGEYLLFLDADDTFADKDFLAGLDVDLSAAGGPDVLIFGYEERRPCGLRRRVNPAASVLRSSWVSWNKAYRRESVAGLRFPPGFYEDFAWSVPAVLGAAQIAVSRRVGVGYRRCTTTSISRRVTPRHFDVFDQFQRILEYLTTHPHHDSPEVRATLAASARTFLRSRTERLRVIPPHLLDDFRRRSEEITARIQGGPSWRPARRDVR
ncbi:glycosyltransferase family 2 protein [Actinocrispum sp. NPDC049592]|uniref:glycosyltransferase family 2 protein n=1 Tax=Actinocrispum sp. NPDC049592 TaxID=3154835 RepID=UPI00344224BF